ncbi:MAG: hypothetical protein O6927_07995, partial [Gammaproteobacteria bacterium]|nr:hypothetical protein [Gammaproteobacteria bacterium]
TNSIGGAGFGTKRILKYPDKYQKPDKCRVAFSIYINYAGFSSNRGKDHAAENDAYLPAC